MAFLVLTAEDEQTDGTLHARENVIHEAGLFQGRLGFEKAIILLEEGCQEFSRHSRTWSDSVSEREHGWQHLRRSVKF